MDENIKLEEEKLIFPDFAYIIKEDSKARIKQLNKIGIFTVADFINADPAYILSSIGTGRMKKNFIMYQQILQYKYRGQKMINDLYLEDEYYKCSDIGYNGHTYEFLTNDPNGDKIAGDIYLALERLGFVQAGCHNYRNYLLKYDKISMIDAIKCVFLNAKYFNKPLAKFYLEYYEKVIKKSETKELDTQNIDDLKNEMVRLLNQRIELDSKISQLVEQINALEGGSITNGRK